MVYYNKLIKINLNFKLRVCQEGLSTEYFRERVFSPSNKNFFSNSSK